ncbi:MAG: glutathione S-transferase family protein [Alphaproteobacteria bacterium]
MKIIGSQTSPFVRAVRTSCEELGLTYELVETSFYAKMQEKDHAVINENNPLMKVPILMDGEQKILDSRVIISYLQEKYETRPVFENSFENKFDAENVISVIYGIIDAGVLRFIMGLEGLDMDRGYMRRSFDRMKAGLDHLDSRAHLGRSFGIPEMTLVCALEWFKKRDIIDWSGHTNIVKTYECWKDRPSLIKTRIPEQA